MNKKWGGFKALLAVVAACALFVGSESPAQAEQEIRVALFVDTGQGYRGVVPAVTLGAASGLSVRIAGNDGVATLPVSTDEARFRIDRYSVLIAETGSLGEAQRLAQQVSQHKLEASILAETRGGSKLYRVVSGSFATLDAAQAHARSIAEKTSRQPVVKGAFRAEAGTYGSLAEARNWENAFESAGIPAHVVLLQKGDTVQFAVWLGDEVSEAARDRLMQNASALFPGLAYRLAREQSYVIVDEEVVSGDGQETIPRYSFSPQVKLVVSPQRGDGVPLIRVAERGQRRYRGVMELSQYNGHLTVVNQLPLNEYLYGVVGSEMASGWPLEALKAQAVLARTRALYQGNKYGIANLSDTVYEQAYYGFDREADDIRRAVDETGNDVIRYQGKLVESLFYSNAGGMTADGREVWGNPLPYLTPVESDDAFPALAVKKWLRVALSDGTIGYVREDFVDWLPGGNPLGLPIGVVNTDNVNFRTGPSTTYHASLFTLPQGTRVTVIASEPEENAFIWSRGPYSAEALTAMINASQERYKQAKFTRPIQTLTVTERGPSGRVLAMEADGIPIYAPSPDAYRSVFQQGDAVLRSTKFEVEMMGTFTVLAANQQTSQFPAGYPLAAVSANGSSPAEVNGSSEDFLLYNGSEWRVVSKRQKFVIRGQGYGHGLGVSQYGARAMAEQGYDYKQILQHYYQGVTIEP